VVCIVCMGRSFENSSFESRQKKLEFFLVWVGPCRGRALYIIKKAAWCRHIKYLTGFLDKLRSFLNI
jgi:hypothetical protein